MSTRTQSNTRRRGKQRVGTITSQVTIEGKTARATFLASELDWKTANDPGTGTNCLELARIPGSTTVAMRNNGDPNHYIVGTPAELAAFKKFDVSSLAAQSAS